MCARRRPFLWGLCFLMALILAPGRASQAEELAPIVVRVLLLEKQDQLSVRGLNLGAQDPDAQKDLELTDDALLTLKASKGKLVLNGKVLESKRVAISSPAVFFYLNGREYEGILEVGLESEKLRAIVHVPLEQYLIGTVVGEMPSDWPLEALKAQAVVARTYAWVQMQRNGSRAFHVYGDSRDQVYRGAGEVNENVAMAVRQTRGVVLTLDGRPVDIFYHSTCGGATELATNVWPMVERALPTTRCAYCAGAAHYQWTLKLPVKEVVSRLKPAGYPGSTIEKIDNIKPSDSGRALLVEVIGGEAQQVYDGNTFRRLLGYDRLKSTRFTASVEGNQVVFQGQGFGHGVGMCQWGARNMAAEGKPAEEILDFYYPGTERRWMSVAPVGAAVSQESSAIPGGGADQQPGSRLEVAPSQPAPATPDADQPEEVPSLPDMSKPAGSAAGSQAGGSPR